MIFHLKNPFMCRIWSFFIDVTILCAFFSTRRGNFLFMSNEMWSYCWFSVFPVSLSWNFKWHRVLENLSTLNSSDSQMKGVNRGSREENANCWKVPSPTNTPHPGYENFSTYDCQAVCTVCGTVLYLHFPNPCSSIRRLPPLCLRITVLFSYRFIQESVSFDETPRILLFLLKYMN